MKETGPKTCYLAHLQKEHLKCVGVVRAPLGTSPVGLITRRSLSVKKKKGRLFAETDTRALTLRLNLHRYHEI